MVYTAFPNTPLIYRFKLMDVPEWLSSVTRNHVGSARASSNIYSYKM